MPFITVINNETGRKRNILLDLNDKLSKVRTILENEGIMLDDNSFLTNEGTVVSRSSENSREGSKLGEFLGTGKTLIVGHSREVLLDDDVTEDIRNLDVSRLRTYFDQRGLYRGMIFTEESVAKGDENIASWDMTEVKLTQPSPVTKKRTESTYTEVGKSMKETGVIAASVSVDTPFGGGEAGYRKQTESSSNSSSIKQFMVSKFVVQKILINIDPEDIRINPAFEREIREALQQDPGEGLKFYSMLLKILGEWGYYVPAGVLLGGMLYATEEAEISSFEESESESTEFSVAVKAKFKGFGGGGSFSNADGREVSETSISKYEVSEFTQVGGIRTAIAGTGAGDFAAWSSSLQSPVNWEVVEYTNLVPSLALLSDRNLAIRCARVIAENSTRRSVRNIQKVLEMFDYSREMKQLFFRGGGGI